MTHVPVRSIEAVVHVFRASMRENIAEDLIIMSLRFSVVTPLVGYFPRWTKLSYGHQNDIVA